MNKIMKRSATFMAMCIAVIMCFIVLAPVFACNSNNEDPGEQIGTIALNKTELTMYIGDIETLTAELSIPENKVTWRSSDTSIASVSSGKVTAKAAGTATITASLSDDVKATCTVKVNDVDITLDRETASIELEGSAEKTLKLNATVSHGTAQWKSSDESIATVSADGTVSFLKAKVATSTVTITAYIGTKEASCEITVTDKTIPADYFAVGRNYAKAELAADEWQYFLKNAHASRVAFAADPISGENAPYYSDGALHFNFTTMSTVEGDDTQYEFRYLPGEALGFAENDAFTLSCTITTNVAGTVHVVKGGNGSADVAVEVGENKFEFDCVATSEPIAIRPLIYTLAEDGTFNFTVSDIKFTAGSPEKPDPDPDPNPPVEEVKYIDIATEHDAMSADSWYQFGNGVTDKIDNLLVDGKIVVTSAVPARMDLFKVDATPTNDNDGDWVNLADKTDNYKTAGKGFYGYEYTYDMTVATTGEFSMILFGTNGLPAQFDGTSHRGLYFFFTDGKVELKQSGAGGDTVQATATYAGTAANITSLKLAITRANDANIIIKLYVNGTKLVMSGDPTTGIIDNGNYVDTIEKTSQGYGQRFGVIPAEGATFTISNLKVKRSETTVVEVPVEPEIAINTAMKLEADTANSKVYIVLTGTYANATEAEVKATYAFDAQVAAGANKNKTTQFTEEAGTVIWSFDKASNTFTVKIDVTDLSADGGFWMHYVKGGDLTCTADESSAITLNGKTYAFKNVVFSWGNRDLLCVDAAA